MSTRTKKTAVKAPKGVTPPTAMGGRSGFLSDVIVELGFATRDTVEQAVRAARSPGTTVARVLVDMGAISEEQLAHATAERYGIDYIDLEGFDLDPAAANLIKPTAAKRYQAVPVGFLGKGLLVAMADPADALGVNDIAVMTKLEVRPAVAARPALDALLESLPLDEFGYDAAPAAKAATQNGDATEAAAEPAEEPAASAAVFWQEGAGDELPDAPAEPAAADGDASQLRDELSALKEQLAGAEAKLKGKAKEAGEASRRGAGGRGAAGTPGRGRGRAGGGARARARVQGGGRRARDAARGPGHRRAGARRGQRTGARGRRRVRRGRGPARPSWPTSRASATRRARRARTPTACASAWTRSRPSATRRARAPARPRPSCAASAPTWTCAAASWRRCEPS